MIKNYFEFHFLNSFIYKDLDIRVHLSNSQNWDASNFKLDDGSRLIKVIYMNCLNRKKEKERVSSFLLMIFSFPLASLTNSDLSHNRHLWDAPKSTEWQVFFFLDNSILLGKFLFFIFYWCVVEAFALTILGVHRPSTRSFLNKCTSSNSKDN